MIEIRHRLNDKVLHRAETLVGADLRGTDLRWADLHKADLREANLSGVNLSLADLIGANLHRADLRKANLTGANLSEANLTGADLRGTVLVEVDLTGVLLPNSTPKLKLMFKRWFAFVLAMLVLAYPSLALGQYIGTLEEQSRMSSAVGDWFSTHDGWLLYWAGMLSFLSIVTCIWSWLTSPPTPKITPFQLVPIVLVIAWYLIFVYQLRQGFI